MAWEQIDSTVTFYCDSCEAERECKVETVRATAQPEPATSDFIMCWRYMQSIGWRSFKRTGRAWTYHCVACGPQAEMEHREHSRQENAREQIKARNA